MKKSKNCRKRFNSPIISPIFTNYFTYFYNYACFVVIRSNSATTNIGIYDPNGKAVNLYGNVGKVVGTNDAHTAIDATKGAIVAPSSLHISDTANIAYLKIAQGHVENNGTVDLVYATTTDVTFTNNGSVDHAHTISKDGANTLNVATKTTGLTYDYNENTEQNSDPEVYHHVATTETVAGDHTPDGTTAWAEGRVDTAAQGVVNNAIAQEMVADFWIDVASDSFAGGVGTESDPYQITNASELARIAKLVNTASSHDEYCNKYYKLMNEIDLSGKAWTPIGNDSYRFSGYLDGNSQNIVGLTNYGKNTKDLDIILHAFSSGGVGGVYGLFGFTSDSAYIHDLSLKDVNINSSDFGVVGAAIGSAFGNTKVENVSTTGNSSITVLKKVGGIVGMYTGSDNSIFTMTNCDNAANITATEDRASGIIGVLYGGCTETVYVSNVTVNITDCDNTGNIVVNMVVY